MKLFFGDELTNIANGKLGGALLKSCINNEFLSAMAQCFNQIIPDQLSGYENLIRTFDTGIEGVLTADGVTDRTEFASNTIIQTILRPDLLLFDSNGNFAPATYTGANGDSISCEFRFSATAATAVTNEPY